MAVDRYLAVEDAVLEVAAKAKRLKQVGKIDDRSNV